VLQVRVAGLPILRWSRSSKHFLPHSLSFLKLPLFAASVPSFDACSQRWLWRYHTRSVQCFAAAVLASCSLAHPACFRKALRTLFVHTELTVVSPFRTSNVIRSVRSSHLFSSSESARPSSARVSARSLIGSWRWLFVRSRWFFGWGGCWRRCLFGSPAATNLLRVTPIPIASRNCSV